MTKFLILAHAAAFSLIVTVYSGMTNFADIADAMAFYGIYHRNPVNQVIHFFGVPCISWSLMYFLCHLELPFLNGVTINIPLAPKHHLNYSTVLIIEYVMFYLKLDLFGGSMYAPFAYLLYVTAVSVTINDQRKALEGMAKKQDDNHKQDQFGPCKTRLGKSWKLALFLHLLGWYVQIHPGHAIYEGAKPALAESFGQAIASGPLFAYYEGLWYLGMNKKLQEEIRNLVDVYTKELCGNGASLRVCDQYIMNA